MKTLLSAAVAAAALTGAAVGGSGPEPGAGGEACWMQADTGRNLTALTAWVAPGVTGEWSLSVVGGAAYESRQSGYVEAYRDPDRPLTRLVVARDNFRPPLRDFTANAPVTPGTTVIGTGYTPSGPASSPLRARLRVFDERGRLICATRDVWHRPGR